jgi:zinc protease
MHYSYIYLMKHDRLLFRLFFAVICLLTAEIRPSFALDLKFDEFMLENGMKVVVIPDHRAPVVTHSVWYRVGSADETSGKTGLAHFLEHLMFKGTTKFPEGQFDKLLKLNGAEGNAFTTRDYTAYYQRAANDRLSLLMELEADRMQSLVLTDANVAPELLVVREERRQRTENSPSALLSEQAEAALYTAHPYGRPIIGWMSEVAKLTKADALAFYRANYTPANAVLIVSGDVNPHAVHMLAKRFYGTLKNTFEPKPRERTAEPLPIAARRVAMTDERAETPYILRNYLGPSASESSGEATSLEFLSAILGSGSRSRLFKSLVLDQKLTASVGAYYNGEQLDSGTFSIFAVPNPGVTFKQIEAAIDAEIEKALRDGVTQAELDRIRNQSLNEQVFSLDDQFNLVRIAGSAIMSGQTTKQAFDTSPWLRVTVESVKAAAQKYLRIENSVTATLSQKKME